MALPRATHLGLDPHLLTRGEVHSLYPGAGQRPRLNRGKQLDLRPQLPGGAIGQAKGKSRARPGPTTISSVSRSASSSAPSWPLGWPNGAGGDRSPELAGARFAVELFSLRQRG